jgi:hypothetical protein
VAKIETHKPGDYGRQSKPDVVHLRDVQELARAEGGRQVKGIRKSESAGMRGVAIMAAAIGATAVGALAIGALAIGRLAIGHVAVGSVKLKKLEIEELTVRRLRAGEVIVSESLELPEGNLERRS